MRHVTVAGEPLELFLVRVPSDVISHPTELCSALDSMVKDNVVDDSVSSTVLSQVPLKFSRTSLPFSVKVSDAGPSEVALTLAVLSPWGGAVVGLLYVGPADAVAPADVGAVGGAAEGPPAGGATGMEHAARAETPIAAKRTLTMGRRYAYIPSLPPLGADRRRALPVPEPARL